MRCTNGESTSRQSDGTITANDNFQNLSEPQIFNYTTDVVLSPNEGTSGASGTFMFDPDVENESGGQLTRLIANTK